MTDSLANENTQSAKRGVKSGNQTPSSSRVSFPIVILGVPFDNVTTREAIGQIEQMIASGLPHYVATANVDFLVQAQRDTELRRILSDAHLVLCDGTPLLWASRVLGNALPERVAGADLVPLLIEVAANRGYRLFFLGASPESADQAVANLRKLYPKLIIAGHYSPPFKPLFQMDHEDIKSRILNASPDILFVGFGCPKQEKWMSMHYRSLQVPVMVGVGATIDFLAGRVKRAPLWMQRSGVEWVFRLAQEPRRLLGRYLTDLWVFGWKILAQGWQMRARRSGNVPEQERAAVQAEAQWQTLQLPEILDLHMVQNYDDLVSQAVSAGSHCFLEMSQVTFVDSTGLGLLVRLQKKLREINRRLVLVSPGPAVRHVLRLVHLEELFCIAQNLEAAKQIVAPNSGPGGNSHVWTTADHDLRWQGEITAANADEVWRKTRVHLDHPWTSASFRIDLSEVTFIDSSGLGMMLRARKWAQRQNRPLIFSGVPSVVRNVLRIARLEKLLLNDDAQGANGSEKGLVASSTAAW